MARRGRSGRSGCESNGEKVSALETETSLGKRERESEERERGIEREGEREETE